MFSGTNPKLLSKRIIAYIFTLFVMTSIFTFSAQPAEKSNNTSKSITAKIVNTVTKNKNITQKKKDELVNKWNDPIRKIAHFSLFLLLGASTFISLVLTFIKKGKHYIQKNAVYSLSFCVFYAVTDEFHQLFVLGRSFQISDIFIDSSGSLTGIIAVCFILYLTQNIKAVA